ncbi:MAG: diaminopimelate epimerase [Desulfosarcina sp.]|nr:diaminopimelate epimerase [Desulfosarcina sp.]
MTFIPWRSNDGPCLVKPGRPFIKMHGLRNDFIIVDARCMPFNPSVAEIRRICDRREGVGGDELLIVEPASPSDAEENIAAFVRIINTDGREVEACGNASRCIGWLLMKERPLESVSFRTLGGKLRCWLKGDKKVSVGMGRLRTAWHEIPLSKEMDSLHLGISAGPLKDPVGMNIGNPHAIFFVKEIDQIDLETYGPELQHHPLFPQEANVGVVQMIDANTMKLVVWERPGALTTACGSGACAAVGAALRRRLTDQRTVNVIMPAGSMEIEIGENEEATMTGPVETCYAGYL